MRSLYLPAAPLPDDPDAGALKDAGADPPGPALTAQNSPVLYGGVRDRNVLHVVAWNSWAEVDGPQHWSTYNGVAVDPYYVWVFGKGGIACATHASMIKCRQQKSRTPAWVYHDFPAPFKAPEVHALSPCVDGTLVVAMQGDIYTADYADRQAQEAAGRHQLVGGAWGRGGAGGQAAGAVLAGAREPARRPGGGAVARRPQPRRRTAVAAVRATWVRSGRRRTGGPGTGPHVRGPVDWVRAADASARG